MPIREASAPWPRWPNEVRSTRRTEARAESALTSRASASPSMPGIFMSRIARSNGAPDAAASWSAARAAPVKVAGALEMEENGVERVKGLQIA